MIWYDTIRYNTICYDKIPKLKNRQNMFFCVFLGCFWAYVGQPHRLSHTNALCINQSYLTKNQCRKFLQKNIENWRNRAFLVSYFDFFSKKVLAFPKKSFFFPMKTTLGFIWGTIFLKFWWSPWFPVQKELPILFCTRL